MTTNTDTLTLTEMYITRRYRLIARAQRDINWDKITKRQHTATVKRLTEEVTTALYIASDYIGHEAASRLDHECAKRGKLLEQQEYQDFLATR